MFLFQAGVLSISHEGDKLIVVGDGIDSVTLTTLLRKKMGYVELVMVTMVEEKKETQEKKEVKLEEEAKSNNKPLIWPDYYVQPMGNMIYPLNHHVNIIEHDSDQNNCCIM